MNEIHRRPSQYFKALRRRLRWRGLIFLGTLHWVRRTRTALGVAAVLTVGGAVAYPLVVNHPAAPVPAQTTTTRPPAPSRPVARRAGGVAPTTATAPPADRVVTPVVALTPTTANTPPPPPVSALLGTIPRTIRTLPTLPQVTVPVLTLPTLPLVSGLLKHCNSLLPLCVNP